MRAPRKAASAKAAGLQSRRDLVLDSAEALFSERGFYGVTVRQVADMAGVDVALPNYYFESKRGLFDAVFLRRAEVLNQQRSDELDAALTAAQTESRTIRVAEILNAFVRPVKTAQSSQDPGWRNYCRLVAEVNSSAVWAGMMTSHFDTLIARFIEALHTALPGVAPKDMYWAYHMLTGALTLTMADTGRIDRLSGGLCQSGDAIDAYGHLVSVFTGAFESLPRA
ncbi:TetR family transcriptional regulator [Asticcacaulis sp. AC460]|uniref:TetR/AcrR family transcriptional regulator n=1 Tax=Asticcacaulis sp. AC460 TaxID=1282360 RepID=UPI0003C40F5F|nr:TetR/AcrR family transcriptional regulator [Asticcacaulis sp. AC460]ESQ90200.1 TetR family transcriptional regulator [Asticcacaulis sp. AC460]